MKYAQWFILTAVLLDLGVALGVRPDPAVLSFGRNSSSPLTKILSSAASAASDGEDGLRWSEHFLQTNVHKRLPTFTFAEEKVTSFRLAIICCVALTLLWITHWAYPLKDAAYFILLAATYCTVSVMEHTLNKICVTLTQAPATVVLIQMVVAAVCVLSTQWKQVTDAPRAQLIRWCVVPVLFAAMLSSSMIGYEYASLSLMTVLRNLAPIATLLVERCAMPEQHQPLVSHQMVGSLVLMAIGAVVYSGSIKYFSWFGFAVLTANTLLAIVDGLIERRLLVSECKDLSTPACMAVNNGLGALPIAALVFALREPASYQGNPQWSDPGVWCMLVASATVGMAVCYIGIECQRIMTATSTQVLHNGSKIAVVAIGISMFGDELNTVAQMSGLALSLCGSLAYGLATARSASQTDTNLPKSVA